MEPRIFFVQPVSWRGMRSQRPLLARVALAATVCLALVGVADTLYLAVGSYRESQAATPAASGDRATEQERRVRPLREHLPARGVVGYISDGLIADSFTSVEALQDYFLTQYALAPVIVLKGTDPPLVVGVYAAEAAAEMTTGRVYPGGLVVLHDLANGVVLLGGAER